MWSRLGEEREKWKPSEQRVASSQQRSSKRSKVAGAEEARKMGAHPRLSLSQRPGYLWRASFLEARDRVDRAISRGPVL